MVVQLLLGETRCGSNMFLSINHLNARDKLNDSPNFMFITSETIQENSIKYNVFALFTPFQKSDIIKKITLTFAKI